MLREAYDDVLLPQPQTSNEKVQQALLLCLYLHFVPVLSSSLRGLFWKVACLRICIRGRHLELGDNFGLETVS